MQEWEFRPLCFVLWPNLYRNEKHHSHLHYDILAARYIWKTKKLWKSVFNAWADELRMRNVVISTKRYRWIINNFVRISTSPLKVNVFRCNNVQHSFCTQTSCFGELWVPLGSGSSTKAPLSEFESCSCRYGSSSSTSAHRIVAMPAPRSEWDCAVAAPIKSIHLVEIRRQRYITSIPSSVRSRLLGMLPLEVGPSEEGGWTCWESGRKEEATRRRINAFCVWPARVRVL